MLQPNLTMKTSKKTKQQNLFKLEKISLCHGGDLRKKRKGRKFRPLSTKQSHHIVFKVIKSNLRNRSFRHPKNFDFVQLILQKYAKKFFVKIADISYQHDHIHIIARSSRRSHFHHFFRVFAGQIAQNLKVTGTLLWMGRPFSRIIESWSNYQRTRAYVHLNELEVTGTLPYRKQRLKGLSKNQLNQITKMASFLFESMNISPSLQLMNFMQPKKSRS